jgi:surface protein
MNTLTELNNFSATTLELTDQRPANVIFDLVAPLYPADQNDQIISTVVSIVPSIEILEIINYATADVRLRVSIIASGSPLLTGSTVTFDTLPSGLSLSQVGSVYTISGISTLAQWNAIKYFTWVLPANFNSCPLWYLDVAILYYNAASSQQRVVDWEVYDPDNYYIAKLNSQFAQSTLIGNKKQFAGAITSSSSLECPGSRVYRFTSSMTSSVTSNIIGRRAKFGASIQTVSANLVAVNTRVKRAAAVISSSSAMSCSAQTIRRSSSIMTAAVSQISSLTDAPFEYQVRIAVSGSSLGIYGVKGDGLIINWGDGTTTNIASVDNSGNSTAISHTYTSSGVKTVSIFGDLTYINMGHAGEVQYIQGVTRFNNKLQSFRTQNYISPTALIDSQLDEFTFAPAIIPNDLTSLSNAFKACANFNYNISSWDTGNITDMERMFAGASSFNQNIGSWDTGLVSDMGSMFRNASSFNQDIGSWDTSNVSDMTNMFRNAGSFDQDISGWCVTLIPTKPTDFDTATSASWITAEKPIWGTCP